MANPDGGIFAGEEVGAGVCLLREGMEVFVVSGSRKFSQLRFCPSCGCEAIERDDYRVENNHARQHGYPEFICRMCGLGFRVVPSLRWEMAVKMFADHRRMRPKADQLDGKGV